MKVQFNEADCINLITRIAAKDRKALEEFYYRFSPAFGAFLMKMLGHREWVDEAINELMFTIWQSAERYDPEKGRLSTWLYGIAHNKGLKILERNGRYREEPIEEQGDDIYLDEEEEDLSPISTFTAGSEPERIVSGWQLGEAISWAFMKLSTDHRTVMDLCFNENLSYQEIADIVGCPINTVKTRLFHARKQTMALLGKKGISLPDGEKVML